MKTLLRASALFLALFVLGGSVTATPIVCTPDGPNLEGDCPEPFCVGVQVCYPDGSCNYQWTCF